MNTEEQHTTKRGCVRRSAEQRRELIREYKRSGESQVNFCRQRNVNTATFSGWLRKAAEDKPAFAEVAMPTSPSFAGTQ